VTVPSKTAFGRSSGSSWVMLTRKTSEDPGGKSHGLCLLHERYGFCTWGKGRTVTHRGSGDGGEWGSMSLLLIRLTPHEGSERPEWTAFRPGRGVVGAHAILPCMFAPSILTLAISVRLSHESGFCAISSVAGLGIDELRMRKPVLVNDELKVKATVVSMRDSQSRPGTGVMTLRIEVSNQKGEVVLSYALSGRVNKRPQ
jgi:hypothetical protein